MSIYKQNLLKGYENLERQRQQVAVRNREVELAYNNILKGQGGAGLNGGALSAYQTMDASIKKQQAEEQARVKTERESKPWYERAFKTAADFGGRLVGGVMKFGENVMDLGATMFGADEEWIKKDHVYNVYGSKLDDYTASSYMNDGKVGKWLQGTAEGIGNMLPSIALTAVTAGAGSASFMLGAAGGGMESALQQGATRGQSIAYGGLAGAAEGLIEKMSGGRGGVGKGFIDGAMRKTVGKTVKSGVGKTIGKTVGKMAGEGLEEVAMDLLDPVLSAITYKGNVDYSGVNLGSIADTFAVGAMTGGIMQGGQAVTRKISPTTDVKARLGEIGEIQTNLTERFNKGKLTEAQYNQGLEDVGYFRDKLIKRISNQSESRQDKMITSLGGASTGVNAIKQAYRDNRQGLDSQGKQDARYNRGKEMLENVGVQLSAQNDTNSVGVKDDIAGERLAMSPSLAISRQKLEFQPSKSKMTAEQAEVIKEHGKLSSGNTKIVFTDELVETATNDGSKVVRNGAYMDGVIYISTRANNPSLEVLKHEFTHSLEDTKQYSKFANRVIDGAGDNSAVAAEFGSASEMLDGVVQDYGHSQAEGTDAIEQAKVYRSELVARFSEKLFADPKAISRLAKANSKLAARAMSYVAGKIKHYNSIKKLTPQEREVKQFLHEIESNYRAAMRQAKPVAKTKVGGGEDRDVKVQYRLEPSKMKELVNQIRNMAPITLQAGNKTIMAEFDKYAGNKNIYTQGKSSDEGYQAKLRNIEKLPDIIEMSRYNKTIKEIGKNTPQHKDVLEWHYFINDIVLNNGETFHIVINIRDKGNSQFVYEVAFGNKKELRQDVRHQGDPILRRQNSTHSIPKTGEKVNNSQEDSKKIAKPANKVQYSIQRNARGDEYVKASRQVLQGDTPYLWGNQVEYFINEVIRKNQDITIPTVEGDSLTLTKNTAGKAKYWDASMSKAGYKTKLNAEIHIDQIAKVSKADRDSQGDIIIESDRQNKHNYKNLAKDGWSYRTAYFQDFDGQRYKIRISVALDEDISSVYNAKQTKKLSSPNVGVTQSPVKIVSTHSISKTGEKVNNSQEDSKKTKFSQTKVGNTAEKVSFIPQKAFKESLQKILDSVYINEESNTAKLKGTQLDSAAKWLTANVNSGKFTDMQIALKLAEELVANINMVDGESRKSLNEEIKKIVEYKGKFKLDSYRSDIAHAFGKEETAKIIREWGQGENTPDKMVSELRESGIMIESENSADIFIELYSKYEEKKEDRDRAIMLSNLLGSEGEKIQKQSFAREIMLEMDALRTKYDKITDKHKMEIAELKQRNNIETEKLNQSKKIEIIELKQHHKAILNDATRRHKGLNWVFSQMDMIRGMVKKPSASNPLSQDYINMAKELLKAKTYRSNVAGKARAALGRFTDIFEAVRKEAGQWIDDCDMGIAETLRQTQKRDGELTTAEIVALGTVLERFRHLAKNEDTAFYNSKRVVVTELAGTAVQEQSLVAKRSKTTVSRKSNTVLDAITDPMAMMKRWAGYDEQSVLFSLYDNLKDGVLNTMAFQQKAYQHFEAVLKKVSKEMPKWREPSIKVGKDGGGYISLGQAMSLMMLSERKQAAAHLDNKGEGSFAVKVVNDKYTAKNKYKLAVETSYEVVMHRDEITALKKNLTKDQLEYLEVAKVFFNDIAKNAKKEIDKDCYGISNVVDNDLYFPMFVSKDGIDVDMYGENAKNLKSIKGFGFNKSANEHAKNNLMLENIVDVVDRHTEQMAMYYGLNKPLELFNKVYNRQMEDGNSLKTMLSKIDPRAEEYIKELLEDVQGIGKRGDNDFITKTSDKLFGYGVTAALGLNLKVLATQWVSLPAALSAGLKIKSLTVGAAHMAKWQATPSERAVVKKVYDYSPLAWDRVKRGASTEIATARSNGGKFGKAVTAGIGFMDKKVVETLWCASLHQVASGVKVYTEEHYKAAAKLLTDIVTQTQQNSNPMFNSKIKRSKSTFVKLSTMFMSDSLKQLSMLRTAFSEYFYFKKACKDLKDQCNSAELEKMKKRRTKAHKQIWRVGTVISCQIVVLTLIAQLFKWLTGKEEEDVWQDMGMDTLGNMLGMLPIIRDFGTLIDGFEPSNFYESGITNIYESIEGIATLLGSLGSGKAVTQTEILNKMRKSILAISQTFGVPVRNLEKYAVGVVGWGGKAGKAAQYEYYSAFNMKNSSEYNTDIDNALAKKKDALAKKNDPLAKKYDNQAKSIFRLKYTRDYAGQSLSDEAIDKLFELYIDEKAKYSAPSPMPKKFSYKDKDDVSQEYAVGKKDAALFKKSYQEASDTINIMIQSSNFKKLTTKQQANAIEKVYAQYLDSVKAELTKDIGTLSFISSAMTISKLMPPADAGILLGALQEIEADKMANGKPKPNSKRRKVLAEVNSYNLSYEDKQIVLMLLGYAPSNKAAIKRAIQRKPFTKVEQDYLLKKL